MHRCTTLPNGLTVVTATMPHMASVSVGLWVGVGGRYEDERSNGASHFLEHLLFKGTRRRSAKRISQDVEGIGGYLNAFTCEENTCFFSKARHDRVHELLDVLLDMFLNSRFAPADIAKEREVIKEETSMYLDQPQHLVQEHLNELLWPGHPLGRSLTGTPASLDRLTRANLLRFRTAHYVAPVTVVAAAGRLRHAELVQAVARHAHRFPAGGRPAFAPAPAPDLTAGARWRKIVKPVEQAQVAWGILTCSRHDRRRYALRLLNTILGENMSSRLFQVVREDRGLAYSIYSSLSFFADTGALEISAGLEPGNLEPTLRLIRRELRRLREEMPTPAELRRARDYVLGQIDLSLEGTENQMMWLGEQWLGYGKLAAAGTVKRHLAAITGGEIRAVAREFLRPERYRLTLVTPAGRGPKLEAYVAAE